MLNDHRTRAQMMKKMEARRARAAGDKPLSEGKPMPKAAETIMPESNTSKETKNKASVEKKKYEKASEATYTGERTKTTTTTDGGTKDVEEKKIKGSYDA